jgi:hypothetical protein
MEYKCEYTESSKHKARIKSCRQELEGASRDLRGKIESDG